MDRRDFLGRAALATAGAGAMAWRPEAAGAAEGPEGSAGTNGAPAAPPGPQLDPNDRSPDRDPLEVQRATLVVNGLDPSNLWPGYLDMLRDGGVDCWHRGGGDVQAFSEAYHFFDEHSDRIVPARTVAEIRQARADGKIAHLFGWQSSENLQRMSPPPPDPTALRAYYEMGLRIVGIAYNVANQFGAGCIEPQIGLTKAGERL
ncbi:MAG TPA: membrane dipeptidase, partial [Longimicrobiales bacterium]|nr:membrane dipeptidase [Longimicrobiales bacterium]